VSFSDGNPVGGQIPHTVEREKLELGDVGNWQSGRASYGLDQVESWFGSFAAPKHVRMRTTVAPNCDHAKIRDRRGGG